MQTLTPEQIIDDVAEWFGVTKRVMLSDRRIVPTRARLVAVWLVRKYTILGYRGVGRYFLNRDHSTIINAVNRIDELLLDKHGPTVEVISHFNEKYSSLFTKIKESSAAPGLIDAESRYRVAEALSNKMNAEEAAAKALNVFLRSVHRKGLLLAMKDSLSEKEASELIRQLEITSQRCIETRDAYYLSMAATARIEA